MENIQPVLADNFFQSPLPSWQSSASMIFWPTLRSVDSDLHIEPHSTFLCECVCVCCCCFGGNTFLEKVGHGGSRVAPVRFLQMEMEA